MIDIQNRYTKLSMVKVLNMKEKILHITYKDVSPRSWELDQVKEQLKTAHPSFYSIYMRKPLEEEPERKKYYFEDF